MIINKDNMKKIHFGDLRYFDFTTHQNLQRREAYLNRAYNIRGKWLENKYSPNNLAINLLWSYIVFFLLSLNSFLKDI